MTSFLIALGLLLFAATLLVVPAFRERADGFRYYVSGRTGTGDLLLRRRMLLENLRDLEIERDQGKLDATEFQNMALPLARDLKIVDARLQTQRGVVAASAAPRTHRLGFTCPVCGCLNRHSTKDPCDQCGTSFS